MKIQYFINLFAIYLLIKCNFLMAQDFSGTHFRNGDLIPHIESNEEWKRADENKKPAWCYYNNDPANGPKYGKLYNWYAVSDPRGLCPVGWHIPREAEWTELNNALGGKDVAGNKMKNTSGWKDNGNGNNSSGFSGLPGGRRYVGGAFNDIGTDGFWWTFDDDWPHGLAYYDGGFHQYVTYMDEENWSGFSVRCLRD
jgi:uncharacterized protein (TIGR02145 family)